MKHSKILLLPLLLMVTSCVSISKEQGGPIFNPDNGSLGEDPNISYYEEGVYGDDIIEAPADAKKLSFKNDKEKAEVSYDDETTSISKDFPSNDTYVLSYQSKKAFKGIYGLKLDFDPHDKSNFLTINLKEGITAQYLKINCSPAFYNTAKNTASGYNFVSKDAAVQVVKDDETLNNKYVKLKAEPVINEGEEPDIKHLAKTYDVTFDLSSPKNSFTIKSYLYSVVINEITFF